MIQGELHRAANIISAVITVVAEATLVVSGSMSDEEPSVSLGLFLVF